MEDFTYTQPPARVLFGSGTLNSLPAELTRQSLSRPLLICSPRLQETISSVLSSPPSTSSDSTIPTSSVPIEPAGIFTEAVMHTPIETTSKALEYLRSITPDSIVSIGGGSAIGLGKALSFRTGLTHMTIPTTYSGSEMTPSLGETKDGRKETKSDERIRASVVIYDVELTKSLSTKMTATSGVNAICHAIEALWSVNRNPVVRLMAIEGVRSMFESLTILVRRPNDVAARKTALYGAYLCGSCLGSGVKMGLHHKLAHTLGGSFNMPHSETHTALLPHTFAYHVGYINPNDLRELVEKIQKVKGFEDLEDPVKMIDLLMKKLGVEKELKNLGLKEQDVDEASKIAIEVVDKMQKGDKDGVIKGTGFLMGNGRAQQKVITEGDVRGILWGAFKGRPGNS